MDGRLLDRQSRYVLDEEKIDSMHRMPWTVACRLLVVFNAGSPIWSESHNTQYGIVAPERQKSPAHLEAQNFVFCVSLGLWSPDIVDSVHHPASGSLVYAPLSRWTKSTKPSERNWSRQNGFCNRKPPRCLLWHPRLLKNQTSQSFSVLMTMWI